MRLAVGIGRLPRCASWCAARGKCDGAPSTTHLEQTLGPRQVRQPVVAEVDELDGPSSSDAVRAPTRT